MEIKRITNNSAANSVECWLLRHGKAPHNKPDEIATFGGGQIDNELTDEGMAETEILADEIFQKTDFDLILCSQMKRSRQTAEIIAKKALEIKNQEIPIAEINDLQEVDVGEFTGHTEIEAKKMDPKAAEYFYSGQVESWNFPGGESYRDLENRIKSVLVQIKKLSPGKSRILIVGHGMFNRAINYYLAKDQEELWLPRSYPHDRVVVFKLS